MNGINSGVSGIFSPCCMQPVCACVENVQGVLIKVAALAVLARLFVAQAFNHAGINLLKQGACKARKMCPLLFNC